MRKIEDLFNLAGTGGGGGADPDLNGLKAYNHLAELGLTASEATITIYNEIDEFSYVVLDHGTVGGDTITDAPETAGTLVLLGDDNDGLGLFHGSATGESHFYRWDAIRGYTKIITQEELDVVTADVLANENDITAIDARVTVLENEPNYVSNFDVSMDFTSIATTDGGDVDMTAMTANDSVVTGDPIKATTITIDEESVGADYKFATATNSVYVPDDANFHDFRFKLEGLYVGKATRVEVKAKSLYTGDGWLGMANYLNGGTTTFNTLVRATTDTTEAGRTGDFPNTYNTYVAEWTPTHETEWFGIRLEKGDIQEIRIENTSPADVLQDLEFRMTQAQLDIHENETDIEELQDKALISSDFDIYSDFTPLATTHGADVDVTTLPKMTNSLDIPDVYNAGLEYTSQEDRILYNATTDGIMFLGKCVFRISNVSTLYPVKLKFRCATTTSSGTNLHLAFQSGGNTDGTGTWTDFYKLSSAVGADDADITTTMQDFEIIMNPTDEDIVIRMSGNKSQIVDFHVVVDTGINSKELISYNFRRSEEWDSRLITTIPTGIITAGKVLTSKDDGMSEWLDPTGGGASIEHGATLPTTGMTDGDYFIKTGGTINEPYIYDGTTWVRVSDYDGDIATIETAVLANTNNITTNTGNIATNTTAIGTINASLPAMINDISANFVAIEALEDDFEGIGYANLPISSSMPLTGYSHGNTMTNEQITAVLRGALGVEVEVPDTGYSQWIAGFNYFGFNGINGGNSSTPNANTAKFIIRKDDIPPYSYLAISKIRASSSGTRKTWVYSGDAEGTLNYPIHPNINGDGDSNTSTSPQTAYYEISSNIAHDDIHVYNSKEYIYDLRIISKQQAIAEMNKDTIISNGAKCYFNLDIGGTGGRVIDPTTEIDNAENYNTAHTGLEIMSFSNKTGGNFRYNSGGYMYTTNADASVEIDLSQLSSATTYRFEFVVRQNNSNNNRQFKFEVWNTATSSWDVMQWLGGTGHAGRWADLNTSDFTIEHRFTTGTPAGTAKYRITGYYCDFLKIGLESVGDKTTEDIIYENWRTIEHLQTEIDTNYPKRVAWVCFNPDTTGMVSGDTFTNVNDGTGDLSVSKRSTGVVRVDLTPSTLVPSSSLGGNQSKYSINIRQQVISDLRTDGSGNLRSWNYDSTWNSWSSASNRFEIVSQLDDGAGYVDADYDDHSASKVYVEIWQEHA